MTLTSDGSAKAYPDDSSAGLTDTPQFFADRPAADGGALDQAIQRDLLSELLRNLHMRGERVFDLAPKPPFAIEFDRAVGTLHVIQQGKLEIELDGESGPMRLERGDVVLIGGRSQTVRSVNDPSADTAGPAHWLCGTFACDDSSASHMLLSRMPTVIELRGIGAQSLLWLDVSWEMLRQEMTTPSPGSQVMISRILDLMFIHVLRTWAGRSDVEPGWLAGVMDPLIGDALSAIHSNPHQAWTVEQLATTCKLSRSAFAQRFTARVGQPPATYLAQLRLATAADLLLGTHDPVALIAASVGYDSEAGFSRAFSRRYGTPPSKWRRQMQDSPVSTAQHFSAAG
jgi:AraC-like DNA-binding protein